MPISIPFDLGTSGASSPISLSSAPSSAASNPVFSAPTMFGNFQVGGSGNEATATMPTPNNVLGLPVPSIGGNGMIILIAGAVFLLLAIKMVHK